MAKNTDFVKCFGVNFSENGLRTPSWAILLHAGGGGGPQADFEGVVGSRSVLRWGTPPYVLKVLF